MPTMVRAAQTKPIEPEYLDEEAQRALLHRLARLEGHLRHVRKMVGERACANEILLQVAAVRAALSEFAARLLDHELKLCLERCMPGIADDRVEKVSRVLSMLLKQS